MTRGFQSEKSPLGFSFQARLAARFAVEAAETGATVLYGTCAEEALVPDEPFVGAVGQTGLDAETIADRVSGLPGELILLVLDDLQWAVPRAQA